MKITLWGINYAPESVGIAPFNTELGEYLAGRGHEVTAVTTFPYYPHWRKQPGDGGRWFRRETMGGVAIDRCWCYVPAAATTLRRIAHELSFALSSLLCVLARPRAEVYLVVSPPLGLGFCAWVATRLKRSRFVFHVQDLQPDAAAGLGMIRHGWLMSTLYRLERLAYAKAERVSGISHGMMEAFRQKGVPEGKCALLPNWLRRGAEVPAALVDRSEARRFFGVADGALLAVYAGNLGRKQNLEIIIEAGAQLRAASPAPANGVTIIMAGDGAARAGLQRLLALQPDAGVRLLPLLSDADYARLLAAADVALITQAAGTGQFFFPSKLLSVLAAGLPVVAVADADSELAGAVREGEFGCTVPPGQANELAARLAHLAGARAQLAVWTVKTKWVQQFSRETILPRFEQLLLAAGRIPDALEREEPPTASPV